MTYSALTRTPTSLNDLEYAIVAADILLRTEAENNEALGVLWHDLVWKYGERYGATHWTEGVLLAELL